MVVKPNPAGARISNIHKIKLVLSSAANSSETSVLTVVPNKHGTFSEYERFIYQSVPNIIPWQPFNNLAIL